VPPALVPPALVPPALEPARPAVPGEPAVDVVPAVLPLDPPTVAAPPLVDGVPATPLPLPPLPDDLPPVALAPAVVPLGLARPSSTGSDEQAAIDNISAVTEISCFIDNAPPGARRK